MKYPRAKPYFSEVDRKEITSKIDGILKSGHIAQGKYVAEFEDKFSKEIKPWFELIITDSNPLSLIQ